MLLISDVKLFISPQVAYEKTLYIVDRHHLRVDDVGMLVNGRVLKLFRKKYQISK